MKDNRSRKNAYLARESTSDSLYTFDEIQERDQFWEATEVSFYEARESKLPRNERFPDVTALSLNPFSNEFKTNGSSLQGASKNRDSAFLSNLEEVEDKVSALDLVSFFSNMETVSPECKKQNSRSKMTETTDGLDKLQSRYFLDDKQETYNSKDFARTNNDNNKTTEAALPFLQKQRQEKRNLVGRKQISNRKESKSHDSNIGIVSGKKLSDSLPPEFYNLRHFLPLLTLCQCPDYDSAVIEAVRDYNDPCCGVTSQICSPY